MKKEEKDINIIPYNYLSECFYLRDTENIKAFWKSDALLDKETKIYEIKDFINSMVFLYFRYILVAICISLLIPIFCIDFNIRDSIIMFFSILFLTLIVFFSGLDFILLMILEIIYERLISKAYLNGIKIPKEIRNQLIEYYQYQKKSNDFEHNCSNCKEEVCWNDYIALLSSICTYKYIAKIWDDFKTNILCNKCIKYFDSIKKRICYNCKKLLSFKDYYCSNFREEPISLVNLWTDDRIQILCCECNNKFKKKEKKQKIRI